MMAATTSAPLGILPHIVWSIENIARQNNKVEKITVELFAKTLTEGETPLSFNEKETTSFSTPFDSSEYTKTLQKLFTKFIQKLPIDLKGRVALECKVSVEGVRPGIGKLSEPMSRTFEEKTTGYPASRAWHLALFDSTAIPRSQFI